MERDQRYAYQILLANFGRSAIAILMPGAGMSDTTIELDEKLDLSAVGALHARISTLLGQDVILDAGNVTHFGALAVQLMRAAARSWADGPGRITLANVSPEVQDQLTLLGFTPQNILEWEATQ